MQLHYRCIDYLSTASQCNACHLKFTSLHYCNAVVDAEMEIRPLQLTATQLQWTMNTAELWVHPGTLTPYMLEFTYWIHDAVWPSLMWVSNTSYQHKHSCVVWIYTILLQSISWIGLHIEGMRSRSRKPRSYRGYFCYWLSAILKGKLKSFQNILWMAFYETSC